MTNQTTGAEQVRWDLSMLYAGINDPQIGIDITGLIKKMKVFTIAYKGHLATQLGKAIADYAEIDMEQSKIMVYLSLENSRDTSNAVMKKKMAAVKQELSEAQGEYLTFFELELIALDHKTLEALYANDEIVARHRPWIEHLRVFKPHVLSESVESALTKRSPFSSDAWDEFFDELEADLRFDLHGEQKTLTEMIHALTDSKDAEERAEIMRLINTGFSGPFAKYSAQNLWIVAGSLAVERRERRHEHPMDVRNKSNRVPDKAVDALHRAVQDIAGPLARRYYRLKAAHLGLTTLKWSDRNAPMPFADTNIVPFDEAIKTVLAAYESFSPTLAKIIRDTVAAQRIDAPATPGKRGGAFNCSLVLPGGEPASFTFLNYLGSNRDVMTLAHELGHGVHGILAGEAQGPLMSRTPIAYCETASVFGEMTTFNFLKDRLVLQGDKQSLLALVMGKIDDVLNTAVRQIGFSNFERRLHGMNDTYTEWQEPEKRSVEEVSAVWLETLQSLYGKNDDVFTYEDTDFLWTYISHFHSPFCVYGYAFGELFTQSLYAERGKLGKNFEPLYLDLLRAGGTKDAVQLMAPFGLNPLDETFWARGISLGLGTMIEEAEQLSREMGVSI